MARESNIKVYDTDRFLLDEDSKSYPLVIEGLFTVYKTPIPSEKGQTKAKFKATIKYPEEYYRKHPTYRDGKPKPEIMGYDIVDIHTNGNIHGKIVAVTSFGVPKEFLTESEQAAFKNMGKYLLCRVTTIVSIAVTEEKLLGIVNPLPLERRMYFGEAGGGTPYHDVNREHLYVYHENMCELTKADLSTLPQYLTDEQTELARVLFTPNIPLRYNVIKASLKKLLTLGNSNRDSIIYHIMKDIYPLGYAELVSKLKTLFPENAHVLDGVSNCKYWESYLCEIVATEKLLTYYMKEYGFEPTEKGYGYLINMQVPIITMLGKCEESSQIPREIIQEIQKIEQRDEEM